MGSRGHGSRKIIILALLPFLLWIAAFELIPVIGMVIASFQNDGGQGFTLGQYAKVLKGELYMQAIKNTLMISVSSSVIAIVIALFTAYSITRFAPKMRDQLLMITNMISNFAGVPLAFAYIVLIGSNGMLTVLFQKLGWQVFADFDLYTHAGLIAVYVYFQVPLGILLLYPSYYGIREEWKDAAALLGASSRQFWQRIGIPVILPGLVGTFSIMVANALGAYATAYALSFNFNIIPIRIAKLVSGDVFLRPELGSAIAVLLAITMIIALLINEALLKYARRGQS